MQHGAGAGIAEAESPDRLARAALRPTADPLDLMGHPALAIEAGPRDAGIPYWQALFTTTTPTAVALAFTQALTDPTPLPRDPDWLDERLLTHLTSQQVVQPHAAAPARPAVASPQGRRGHR
ncbi:DUF317 domain-containing protein [Streptacidiphilus fuscans]|uniref:DUF317 domain-containing protein n=1 Tax=Streptacidiphilus fuscans TaxID=2789292 RepID=A0A931BA22_9ACTN|nr:DUF317 domain-containing protein [Streptacidiphilus fuscans]MBF9071791.1 DUF317 domain-containing protein [Streptacidiphilus fuscans]